jgi:hypothetical protein
MMLMRPSGSINYSVRIEKERSVLGDLECALLHKVNHCSERQALRF